MQDLIAFKGIREGILVTIEPATDWGSVVSELITRIDNQATFFRGATIVLQLDGRTVHRPDLAHLFEQLENREVHLVSVLSSSASTQGATRQLGLAIDLRDVAPPPIREAAPQFPEKMFAEPIDGSEGVLIRRTVRSGRIIRSPGHVVVVGDVNAGAEIIAGGDVVVWGHLRGLVHAGALGDETSVVCALNLQPTQLRIGSLISVSPPPNKRRKSRPERAYIENGQITAEPWQF